LDRLFITTYLLRVRSLRENLRRRLLARSIRQGRGLRFSRKDRMFEVNKLFVMWLFSLFCKPVISPWALQENNTLQLANQSARYIGHKNNLCNKHVYQSSIISWADLFLKFIGWLRFSFLMAWQWKPAIEKSCMLGTTGRSGAVLFYGESWWWAYPILYGYIIEFKLMRPTLKV